MKKALIIGGSNGIGLSIVLNLYGYDNIYIVDKQSPDIPLPSHVSFYQFDLCSADFSFFNQFEDIDSLIITAGFGRLSLFSDLKEDEIISSFMVNSVAVIRVLKIFYNKLLQKDADFLCAVMGSISGYLSSPFYSVYGATKAAICKFIESINVELYRSGTTNRILNVSPGSIKGTRFNNGDNDLNVTQALAKEIIEQMHNKNDLYIPEYEEVYKNVLQRYNSDFRTFGLQSYDYKKNTKRLEKE